LFVIIATPIIAITEAISTIAKLSTTTLLLTKAASI